MWGLRTKSHQRVRAFYTVLGAQPLLYGARGGLRQMSFYIVQGATSRDQLNPPPTRGPRVSCTPKRRMRRHFLSLEKDTALQEVTVEISIVLVQLSWQFLFDALLTAFPHAPYHPCSLQVFLMRPPTDSYR